MRIHDTLAENAVRFVHDTYRDGYRAGLFYAIGHVGCLAAITPGGITVKQLLGEIKNLNLILTNEMEKTNDRHEI
jgi:hypothetical protein